MSNIVVHPGLEPVLKLRINHAFTTLHEDEKTASILEQLKIECFDEGDDPMYGSLHEIPAYVRELNEG